MKTIRFLGAVGTVTGSKFLVEDGDTRVLVDCGLFQGHKELRLLNREAFPIEPESIAAVALTHAHLDHSGYLPLFVRNGYQGKVFATSGTAALCSIILPDSGRIQEEDARYANKAGYSRHKPALPLYTEEDAKNALKLLEVIPFEDPVDIAKGFRLTLHTAGHILGASSAHLDGSASVLFSGDLGRSDDLLMGPPATGLGTDYLVVESTYGDREHPEEDPLEALAEVITKTIRRGGIVLIPAFAVGRAQLIILAVDRLRREGRIPDVPMYLDSPMATDVLQLYSHHCEEHRLSPEECGRLSGAATLVTTVSQSKALDHRSEPMILISASGMATGGRVLHHLRVFATDPQSTILFVGYQAGGTRGAAMTTGATTVKIHGELVPIRAEVALLNNFSAHADAPAIVEWLRSFRRMPKKTFVVHGEPEASIALAERIGRELGWSCAVPGYGDRFTLEE